MRKGKIGGLTRPLRQDWPPGVPLVLFWRFCLGVNGGLMTKGSVSVASGKPGRLGFYTKTW